MERCADSKSEGKLENLQRIHEIIKGYVGSENAIPVKEISKLLGRDHNFDFHYSNVRSLLLESSKYYGFPLGSNGKGYFIIKDEEELREYVRHLTQRMHGIRCRIDLVMDNFILRGKKEKGE